MSVIFLTSNTLRFWMIGCLNIGLLGFCVLISNAQTMKSSIEIVEADSKNQMYFESPKGFLNERGASSKAIDSLFTQHGGIEISGSADRRDIGLDTSEKMQQIPKWSMSIQMSPGAFQRRINLTHPSSILVAAEIKSIVTNTPTLAATVMLSSTIAPVAAKALLSTTTAASKVAGPVLTPSLTVLPSLGSNILSQNTQIWVGLATIGIILVAWFIKSVITSARRSQTKPHHKDSQSLISQSTTSQKSINPDIANLRDILAFLYPDEPSIRRVINDSSIDLPRIALTSTPINSWHSILTEANKINKVDALLHVVEREYGGNKEFQKACDSYRQLI